MSSIVQLICRCFIVLLAGCALGCIGVSGGGKKGADTDTDASMSSPDGSAEDAASADASVGSDAVNDVLAADGYNHRCRDGTSDAALPRQWCWGRVPTDARGRIG